MQYRLQGLEPGKAYRFKTTYTCYARDLDDKDKVNAIEGNVSQECVITQEAWRVVYKTQPVKQRRRKVDPGWDLVGVRDRATAGMEPCGCDMKIWLNGILIYEEKCRKAPVYYYVRHN